LVDCYEKVTFFRDVIMSEQLKKKTCFVIAPIDKEGSPTRRRSDQVHKHIIEPAAKECGYEEVVRADGISKPGIITSQVIQRLVDDSLVVADLTDHNPNVFYELAVRHATRKPVILLIEKSQHIPFDVSQNRVIQYEFGDWDSLPRCKEELVKQIRSIQQDHSDVDNPISNTIDLKSQQQSGDPVAKISTQIILMRDELRSLVEELGQRPAVRYETEKEAVGPPDLVRTNIPMWYPLLERARERDLTLILAKNMIEKELSNPQKKNREEREALTVALRMITVLSKPESMLPEILQGRPITQEEYEQARIFVDLCLGRVGYRRRP